MRLFFLVCLIGLTSVCFAQNQDKSALDVYRYVEQMPVPTYNVSQYLSQNIVYPDSAIKHNIEGRVKIEFVVSETGEIENTRVLGEQTFGYGLEEEALRVVKAMPRWMPGYQGGKAVRVYYTLPITFKLADDEPEKKDKQ